jgi:hypothetical protein
VGRLEGEIERLREEIEALRRGHEQPKVLGPEDEERFLKIVECLLEDRPVPDELLEEPKAEDIVSERDFLPVLKKTLEEYDDFDYPGD